MPTSTPEALKQYQGVSLQEAQTKVEVLPSQMIHEAWEALEEITNAGNVNPQQLVQVARVVGGFEALTFAFDKQTERSAIQQLISNGKTTYGKSSS